MSRLLPYIVFLTFIVGCQRDENPDPKCMDPTDPNCENYDPCLVENPVSADFKMESKLTYAYGYDTIYIEETSQAGLGVIRFTAVEEGANYKWYIGADTFYTRSFELLFTESGVILGSTISFTLIVEKEPNPVCHPNDNGKDTVTKSLKFIDRCDYSISNKFYGSFESNPNDSFEVKIETFNPSADSSLGCFQIRFSNLDNGKSVCSDLWLPETFFSNRYALILDGYIYSFCGSPTGEILVDEEANTLRMELFFIYDEDGDGFLLDEQRDTIPNIFHGRLK